MNEHEVVIAGAGPTGLMLASELALAGVDVAIVERRPDRALEGARAGGLHPRTLELLDQRGLAERFVSRGRKLGVVQFADSALAIDDLPSRHNYWLALWQNEIEAILADRVEELGIVVHRGLEVAGFGEAGAGIRVDLSDGRTFRSAYLVGCDGGRSRVRKEAGIGFPGWEPANSYLIFEAVTVEEPAWGLRHGEKGLSAIGKLDEGERMRGVLIEPTLREGGQPTEEELRQALSAVYGTDFGIRDITWLSRFSDAARQAADYRRGRVLLAGDAAHIHSPAGGQGLNLGVQDAVNLGWKLGQVVRGTAPESLLDTYHAERHPVGAGVLRLTLALTALHRGDARTGALRAFLAGVMAMDEPRRWYAALVSGLDIRYDLGEAHPLAGRRMPDIEIHAADGPVRVSALLHDGRPLLLEFGAPGEQEPGLEPGRVRRIRGRPAPADRDPAIGPTPDADAILVRPDGYVAWAGNGSRQGLSEALVRWFGSSAAA